MERVCFLARVRPDRRDDYRERHKAVWPEMRASLAAAGWGNPLYPPEAGPMKNHDYIGPAFARLEEIFHLD